MQLRPDIQIQSVLKAMNDVVLPALDPNNPLAQEQARLCMGMLALMAERLPLQYRFDCDELARLLALSSRLQQLAEAHRLAPEPMSTLVEKTRVAADVLDRARAEPSEVLGAIRALRAATGRLIQVASTEGRADEVGDLERLVLDASKEQLLRDRSWVVGQGWEIDPAAIPSIETLIAPRAGRPG